MFKPGPSVWTATIQNVPLTVLFTLTRDTLHTTGLFEATSTPVELWKYANFTEPVFLSFSQALNKFLDAGASLSRPVRFDLCPTNRSVTVFRSKTSMSNGSSTVLTLDRMDFDFSTNKLKISMSNTSFRNFNSSLDRMDFEVIFLQINLNTANSYHLSTSEPRGEDPSSVYSTPKSVFGSPLRALFSQNRDFFY